MATVPAMLAGTGCYEYHATSVSSVKPGQSVHLVLNQEGAASLTSSIGPNAASLDGKIIRTSPNEVVLAVTQIVRTAGPEEFMKDEPLSIPATGATSVTVRSLDKPRTVLAIGAILTGVILGNIIANQAGIFTTKTGPSGSTK
jgi:hypothetical protein